MLVDGAKVMGFPAMKASGHILWPGHLELCVALLLHLVTKIHSTCSLCSGSSLAFEVEKVRLLHANEILDTFKTTACGLLSQPGNATGANGTYSVSLVSY